MGDIHFHPFIPDSYPIANEISIYTRFQPLGSRLEEQAQCAVKALHRKRLPVTIPNPGTIILLKENDSRKPVWNKSLIEIEEAN